MKKKLLSLLLALVMVLSMLPAVSAAEVLESGSAGEQITWTMYDDGRLVFSGTGSTMENNSYSAPAWSRYMGDIRDVIFEEGITHIGEYLFYNSRSAIFDSVETLTLPASLEKIGENAFTGLDGLHTVNICDLERWCAVDFTGCTTPLDNQVALAVNGSVVEALVIPEAVTVLTDYAFMGCSSIRSAVIHENVTRIGSFAFNTCTNLNAVYFQGNAPAFGEHVFTLSELTAYYPANDPTWSDIITMDLGGTVTWVPYDPQPFPDVPADAFYYASVLWALENNITTGTTVTTFSPDASCNRAQAVTFLWRAAGCPAPASTENPFVDVKKGEFYEQAVLWAVENGITNGTDATHFSPDKACNRATIVTFLHRAFENPAVENTENPFSDVPADTWYTAPVLWAVEQGITLGMGEGLFGVDSTCNRAQMVTFLHRAYN